jgi:hypothetical protein
MEIEAALTAFIGRGGGLTPAGDDMLVGIMGALAVLPSERYNRLFGMVRRVVEREKGRTHPVAAHFLCEAARGRYVERVKLLLEALSDPGEKRLEDAIGRVLKYGASSGADLMCGMLLAFMLPD